MKINFQFPIVESISLGWLYYLLLTFLVHFIYFLLFLTMKKHHRFLILFYQILLKMTAVITYTSVLSHSFQRRAKDYADMVVHNYSTVT